MRDVPDWLFVFGVATFVFGLMMVTAGLVPSDNGRYIYAPLALAPGGGAMTAVFPPGERIRSGSDRRRQSLAARSVRDARACPSVSTAFLRNHGSSRDCGLLRDGIARRTYLRQSAAVVHDHLVRRSPHERVD
jgi:hypothetical protein